MFKKIVLIFSGCAALVCAGQELLLNGDFSQGLKHWRIKNPNGVSIEEKAAPGGKNALKVISAKEHYGANSSLGGKKLKPDTDYTVRGKIKTEGNAKVYLYFCRYPEAGRHHSSSPVFQQTTDWTEVCFLLNSGKAKSMYLLTRVIGQGTAWFADLSIEEGNHLPKENLFLNSDFKLRTRYREVPDNWSPANQAGIAAPENFVFRLSPVPPPAAGAGVLEVKNALLHGNLIQRPVPGLPYTYSFYARNAQPEKPVEIHVRCGSISRKIQLTDNWKRYSFTEKFQTGWPSIQVRATAYDSSFFFSAPQLIPGTAAQPWQTPKPAAAAADSTIKEAVAEAVSRKIPGEPSPAEWAKAPALPIRHITRGTPDGVIPSDAKILHNGKDIFVRFTGKKDPSIKTGNRSSLDWRALSDTFELFITDTALDGTYIQYAVNINGHDYTGRNQTSEMLGITSRVSENAGQWHADVRIPLGLFKANRNWKIAFGRCYDHVRQGRMSLDWSLPGSRHNTGKFGILKGIAVTPAASLKLEKLYGSIDGRRLHYEFSGLKPEMLGSTLTAAIRQNQKTLWSSSQKLDRAAGEIVLPENYEKMMETQTRIALSVTGKNGKNYYLASRVLYLMFSSYAKLNPAMFVYPKYNFFTDRDKTVDLIVRMDPEKFDRLRIGVLNEKGETVFQSETTGDLSIPGEKIPFGEFKIKAEALKKGKTADVRCHENFRKLPFRPEMIRINRQQGCLMNAKEGILPMLYYPGATPHVALDRDLERNKPLLFTEAAKYGFTGIKTNFYFRLIPDQVARWLKIAEKHQMYYLADLEWLYPNQFYGKGSENMTSGEAEKILIGYTGKLQESCFGKAGILAYCPYHEPGYHRHGKGIVDSYRVAAILPELRKADPYRPITGFWAPPHWDANGEPFGSVDGVDYFTVDIYSRDLKMHCDELFRIANASRAVRRPMGQIFNIDNLGSELRECPTPAEYRAEVYAALIAGYRVFFNYIGLPSVRETWREMVEVNRQLPAIAKFICSGQCRELASVNGENVCYAVFRKGKEILVIASSKENHSKVRLCIDLKKLCGLEQANGKTFFGPDAVTVKNGEFEQLLPPAGSGIWLFRKK